MLWANVLTAPLWLDRAFYFVRDQLRRKFLSTPAQIIVERGRSGSMEEP
jgi:hypothetical protein